MHVHANQATQDATTGKIAENDTAEIDLCLLYPTPRLVSTGVGRHFLAILRRSKNHYSSGVIPGSCQVCPVEVIGWT